MRTPATILRVRTRPPVPTFGESCDMDDDLQQILDGYGFDEPSFTKLREEVRSGSLSPTSNVLTGVVEPR
jgi:hypothetical protein